MDTLLCDIIFIVYPVYHYAPRTHFLIELFITAAFIIIHIHTVLLLLLLLLSSFLRVIILLFIRGREPDVQARRVFEDNDLRPYIHVQRTRVIIIFGFLDKGVGDRV